MSNPLAPFLRLACDTVFNNVWNSKRPLTLVLGNTSADLDSFISAVVFAFFHTKEPQSSHESRIYVPLLNLTDVSSSDLWRLRPEYGTALRLAVHGQEKASDDDTNKGQEKRLLKDLVTLSDIRGSLSSGLHATFAVKSSSFAQPRSKVDMVLVDHNAPQIPGLSSDDITSRFNLTGVIDHHVEENAVHAEASPRIVKTGIGSCCSLVVQHLRDSQRWPASSKDGNYVQVAKLALAPILIDTANLTATGDKISDTDRQVVKFLESHIASSDPEFDRTAFYKEIQQSKSNSLNLLTMPEIFERDYKEWTEQPKNTSNPINIGIASLVKDLPWLLKHAGSPSKLTEALHSFARNTSHDLSILALITKGEGPNGEFRKELAIVAYGESASEATEIFEKDAGELQLQEWKEDDEISTALGDIAAMNEHIKTAYRIWWQGDVSKSRKQVAPLLRGAVQKA